MGPPVWRPVLDFLAAYTSTTVYTSATYQSNFNRNNSLISHTTYIAPTKIQTQDLPGAKQTAYQCATGHQFAWWLMLMNRLYFVQKSPCGPKRNTAHSFFFEQAACQFIMGLSSSIDGLKTSKGSDWGGARNPPPLQTLPHFPNLKKSPMIHA